MPARQRPAQGADSEPTAIEEKGTTSSAALTQETYMAHASKKHNNLWQGVINMVERDIAEETTANRLENMRAVLAFIREHGYPDDG